MNKNSKILVAIFHKDGIHNENFTELNSIFREFDLYIPTVEFYGNKWKDTKAFFINNDYDSLFLICSDVKVVCGNIKSRIAYYANDKQLGTYGFGTLNKFTFIWQQYNSFELIRNVPFVEGYCFGVNKTLLVQLEWDDIYGYGLDVEMGYKSYINGMKCVIDSTVCVWHDGGKSYDDTVATSEYIDFLIKYPAIKHYLNQNGIFHPLSNESKKETYISINQSI